MVMLTGVKNMQEKQDHMLMEKYVKKNYQAHSE